MTWRPHRVLLPDGTCMLLDMFINLDGRAVGVGQPIELLDAFADPGALDDHLQQLRLAPMLPADYDYAEELDHVHSQDELEALGLPSVPIVTHA